MLQVIFVMGLTAMGFYFLSGYFVSYVQTTGNLSREQSLLANAAAMALYALLLPLGGIIGDQRRPQADAHRRFRRAGRALRSRASCW